MGISVTNAPSIDQVALQTFEKNYYRLTQQMQSYLKGTGVIKFVAPEGKTKNQARIGRIELTEVAGRNPEWQVQDHNMDNRQFTKRRFTVTLLLDDKTDINELISDPTSELLEAMKAGQERVMDRVTVQSAIGPVRVGRPDEATSDLSASADGVITIDATSGLTYAKIQEIKENFINSECGDEKVIFALTGKEHTQLMGIDEFINNDYIDNKPVQSGDMKTVNGFNIVKFAGSSTGGATVPNPIIPEGETTRDCPVMLPQSIVMASKLAKLNVIENVPGYVNTTSLTIDYWIGAMRQEGVKCQIVRTTI